MMDEEFVGTLACPITGRPLRRQVAEKPGAFVTAPIDGKDEALIMRYPSTYESLCAAKGAGARVRVSYPLVKGIVVLLPDRATCVQSR